MRYALRKTPVLRLLAAAILALALVPQVRALDAPAAETWREATAAYEREDYVRAQSLFESLLPKEGRPAADLAFNLGNVYSRLGRDPEAVWMYERALRADPRHADARRNLRIVRGRLDLPAAGNGFVLFRPVAWIAARLTPGEWFVLFDFAFFAAALALAARFLRRPGAKGRRGATVVALACGLVALTALAFAVPRWRLQEKVQTAVVLTADAVVRAAPGRTDEASAYFEAAAGNTMEVQPTHLAGWLKVKDPRTGRVGYLPESSLGRL